MIFSLQILEGFLDFFLLLIYNLGLFFFTLIDFIFTTILGFQKNWVGSTKFPFTHPPSCPTSPQFPALLTSWINVVHLWQLSTIYIKVHSALYCSMSFDNA